MESDKATFASIVKGIRTRTRLPSWALLFLLFTLITVLSLQLPTTSFFPTWALSSQPEPEPVSESISCSNFFRVVPRRKIVMSIEDFGGVGDGKTSNTESFRSAIRYMQSFRDRGGSQLNIPKGTWLTGSFNLTSDFTLFLQHGAVILASQVPSLPPSFIPYII